MYEYIYLIEVKCVAPEGYKPKTFTFKGIGVSRNGNTGEQLKDRAISLVQKQLTDQNPGIQLKFSASILRRTNKFIIDIDDELSDKSGSMRPA